MLLSCGVDRPLSTASLCAGLATPMLSRDEIAANDDQTDDPATDDARRPCVAS